MKFSLSCLIINVKDIDRAETFYRDILGMKFVAKRTAYLELELGGTTFLIEAENASRAAGFDELRIGGRTGIVLEVDDVRAAVDWLRGQNVRIVVDAVDQPWGTNAIFADPDGNEFILENGT